MWYSPNNTNNPKSVVAMIFLCSMISSIFNSFWSNEKYLFRISEFNEMSRILRRAMNKAWGNILLRQLQIWLIICCLCVVLAVHISQYIEHHIRSTLVQRRKWNLAHHFFCKFSMIIRAVFHNQCGTKAQIWLLKSLRNGVQSISLNSKERKKIPRQRCKHKHKHFYLCVSWSDEILFPFNQ